jgi:hypothetical protein
MGRMSGPGQRNALPSVVTIHAGASSRPTRLFSVAGTNRVPWITWRRMGHSEHEQLSRAAFGANSQREYKGWPVSCHPPDRQSAHRQR